MRVLGIETSCDETGAAIYDSESGLLAHTLYSQVEMHAEYGGVVPELASRRKSPVLEISTREHCTSPDTSTAAYSRLRGNCLAYRPSNRTPSSRRGALIFRRGRKCMVNGRPAPAEGSN